MSLKLLSLPKVRQLHFLFELFKIYDVMRSSWGDIQLEKDWLCSPINPLRFTHIKPIEIS